MNTPPENEFPEVRRLLALKRHEQPPPGYFNNLSKEIIAELKAERFRRKRSRDSQDAPQWIVRLLDRLRAQPAFAGASAVLLGAVLVGGFVVGEKNTDEAVKMPSLLSDAADAAVRPADATVALTPRAFEPVTADGPLPLMASNDFQRRPSLFDSMPSIAPITVDDRPDPYMLNH